MYVYTQHSISSEFFIPPFFFYLRFFSIFTCSFSGTNCDKVFQCFTHFEFLLSSCWLLWSSSIVWDQRIKIREVSSILQKGWRITHLKERSHSYQQHNPLDPATRCHKTNVQSSIHNWFTPAAALFHFIIVYISWISEPLSIVMNSNVLEYIILWLPHIVKK